MDVRVCTIVCPPQPTNTHLTIPWQKWDVYFFLQQFWKVLWPLETKAFLSPFASWFNWSAHLLSLHICHMIRKHVLTSNHANPCWIASQSRIAHNFSANCRVSRFGPKSIRAQGGNKICLLLKGLFLMNSAIDSIKEIYLHDYWHWL